MSDRADPVRLLPYSERLKLYEREKDRLLQRERSSPASEFQRKLQDLIKKYDL